MPNRLPRVAPSRYDPRAPTATEMLRARVTSEQLDRVRRAAQAAGETLSEFVRRVVLEAAGES